MKLIRLIASLIGTGSRAFVALVGIAGITAAVANYAMTQGAGTNFGSVIVGGVHYAQQLICDVTTPSQCGAVTASGEQKVLDSQVLAAIQAPIPTQASTVSIGGVGLFSGGSSLSSTNGIYTNLLQGNAVLSTSNPVFAQLTTGGAAIGSITNTSFASTQSGTWTVQPGNTANTTPWLANPTSQYPSGATPITASATGTTGATTATLAGAVSKTTYICSLSIRSNATAAATGNATVTGTITGTLNYTHWTAPLASGIGVTEQIYSPCAPASATNTGIAVASPAPGAGGTVSVSATGYQL